jgi:hypothetical protein
MQIEYLQVFVLPEETITLETKDDAKASKNTFSPMLNY